MAWSGHGLRGGAGVAAVAIAIGACNNQFGDDKFNDGSGSGEQTEGSSNSADNGSSADDGMTAVDDGSSGDDSGEAGGPKLDVMPPDGGLNPCGCEFSYIWISNADESTVSKINVVTMEEEARYLTRADGAGNPSRTSVNLSGDVAIANRHGGLVKFWAEESDCVESNGMPGIQTSHGPGEVLAWDVEECRAWYADFPGVTNQRPVAWTAGEVEAGTCNSVDAQVWTVVSATPGIAPGTGGAGGVIAYLLDDDGSIAETVPIDGFAGIQLGAYGGAVDSSGNLYFTPMGGITFGGHLARVERDTLDVTLWELEPGINPYGITVDHNNKVWISGVLGAGAARFDPDTAVWDQVQGFVSLGGLMEGPDDLMWVATSTGAISVDINSLDIGPVFNTNMGGETKGISADASGHIWVVNSIAFKVDPQTATAVDFYNGLTSPYTYSDMTGYALGNVICPPEG